MMIGWGWIYGAVVSTIASFLNFQIFCMKLYFSKSEAVIDLHERGFTKDFQLLGNNLLWIQGKIFLRQKDFFIVECHHFLEAVGKETIIFGVTAKSSLVSGILIKHYKSYADKTPAIIDNKLKIMVSGLLNTEANFMDVVFTQ
jgi:hypothetical protein